MDVSLFASLNGSCQVKSFIEIASSEPRYSLPKLWSLAKIAFLTLFDDFLPVLVPSANRVVLLSSSGAPSS
jgi:hypothetical protein